MNTLTQPGLDVLLPRAGRPADTTSTPARHALDLLDRVDGGLASRQAARTVVLVSRDYPPCHTGGIATFVHALAHALHAMGHRVHVVASSDSDRSEHVDDHGVQVHRVAERAVRRPLGAVRLRVPRRIWRWSASAFAKVAELDRIHAVDLVEAPIWTCEGIAFLLDRRWPLVTSLHTTLHTWMESNPRKSKAWLWQYAYGRPMLALERLLMTQADGIRANSQAIIREIERAYDMAFDPLVTHVVPHGLLPVEVPAPAARTDEERIELLFVGRLEERKGIAVLLRALPGLMARWPGLHVNILGDTHIRNAEGRYEMDEFQARHHDQPWLPRVVFEGRVDDTRLLQAYADCDLFVGPSLFESFGLVFVEAMRQGKPVIACDAGGMPEVVQQGVTGLLVPPGDAGSLEAAIERLLGDAWLRRTLGEAGLDAYRQRFSASRMAADSLPLYDAARQAHRRAAERA
ncbi:glycosyltransferase family 4 protein [Comamonadaceae bacterium PP-2]